MDKKYITYLWALILRITLKGLLMLLHIWDLNLIPFNSSLVYFSEVPNHVCKSPRAHFLLIRGKYLGACKEFMNLLPLFKYIGETNFLKLKWQSILCGSNNNDGVDGDEMKGFQSSTAGERRLQSIKVLWCLLRGGIPEMVLLAFKIQYCLSVPDFFKS